MVRYTLRFSEYDEGAIGFLVQKFNHTSNRPQENDAI